MGNCCRHESSMTWADEDWDSPAGGGFFDEAQTMKSEREEDRLEEEKRGGISSSSSSSSSSTEVKIKISKKQLEELLGRVDMQGLSVEQVLSQLMKVSDDYQTHQRSWRPALQSIPEVNER